MKVNIELKYKGKTYNFTDDGYEDIEHAEYMWEEGNYSCDCNKSLFIQRNCDESFNYGEEMPCGDKIELVSLVESKSGGIK